MAALAVASGGQAVRITWNPSPGPELSHYEIGAGTNGGFPVILQLPNTTETSLALDGLPWRVAVRAVGSNGLRSAWSNALLIQPPEAPGHLGAPALALDWPLATSLDSGRTWTTNRSPAVVIRATNPHALFAGPGIRALPARVSELTTNPPALTLPQ